MIEHELLEHFLRVARTSEHGVVCVGSDVLIANRFAVRLIGDLHPSPTWERLTRARPGSTTQLRGSDGRHVIVEYRNLDVAGDRTARMLLLRPSDPSDRAAAPGSPVPGLVGVSAGWHEVSLRIEELATLNGHVLVTGERGVGKLRAARAIAEVRGLVPQVLDAGAAGAAGSTAWLDGLAAALVRAPDDALVIVARLERLAPEALVRLAHVLRSGSVPTVSTAVCPERGGPTADRLDRLGIFTGRIHIPALRHRADDVPHLARHFGARHSFRQLVWTDEVLEDLARYLWPGNVKELEQVVNALVKAASDGVIERDLLPQDLRRGVRRRPLSRLEDAEVDVMLAALAEADGSKDLAAHLIGIHRATLYRKLQNYGLDWPSSDS